MKRTISLIVAGIAGALIALLALNFATNTFAQGTPRPPPAPARCRAVVAWAAAR